MQPPTGTGAAAGFALLGVMLLGSGVLSYYNTAELVDQEERVAHTRQVLAELESLLAALKDAEVEQRGFLATADAGFLELYHAAEEGVRERLGAVRRLTADNAEQQQRVARLHDKVEAKLAAMRQAIALVKDNPAAARETLRPDEARQWAGTAAGLVAEMQGVEYGLLRDRAAQSARSFRIAVASNLLADAAAILLVVLVYHLVRRNLALRDRAARAVARERERLHVTLASIGDAVIATDAAGRVTMLNPVAEVLTGWTQEEARDRPLDEVFRIINEDTRRPVETPVARVLREGAVVGLANHSALIARDGSERPIADSGAPIRDDRGTVQGVVLVFRDVADQRQAERALRESEARFRGIVETANEGIWVLDAGATITLVNPRMAEMLGYAPADLLGRKKWDFLFGEDRPHLMALFERRRAGISEQVDVRFRHRAGRPVWTLMASRPILSAEGEFRGALDLFTDITERRRLQDDLQRRADELAEANRQKDAFLAMLAHELRNPMAPLLTSLHVLREADDDAGVRKRSLDRIERQARHLNRLVEDLLDVARIRRGGIPLRPTRLDLARLVRTAAEDHRTSLERAGLTLAVQSPDTPVWVEGDETRLTQCVINLLDNAARHAGPGGTVTVEAQADRAAGQALFTVFDNGAGIAPELLPRLFEPFEQAAQGPERARGGLGLGLAVVKGLVEAHGGTIAAASAGPGQGAQFTVRLPLGSEPAALTETPPHPALTGGPHRVLVIEDQRDAADSLRLLLELLGHEARVAYSGPAGIREAVAFRPEVVISDIGLPGLDGYGVARALRADPATARARLIALTGYGSEEDRRRGAEAGFDHYLVKPADPVELQRVLAAPVG
jgi:PAS domain S-box-containing protein